MHIIVSKKNLIALGLVFFLSACLSTRSSERSRDGTEIYIDQASPEEKDQLRQNLVTELKQGLSRYHLSAGDVLEVMYHISSQAQSRNYRIGVSDELNIEFFHQPEMNRTAVVRPDGKMTLPVKGDFEAVGLTPMDLAAKIRSSYADMLNNPVVTVTVSKFSSRIADLQKAITNAQRGQAKAFPLSPDGYIYLPLLEPVKAAGKTVDQLQGEINAGYHKEFENLEVSVLIESLVGSRIFIFGEVQRPGTMAVYHPVSVLEAIAMSGGVLPTGSLEKIKVLFWNERNEPIVKTVNLENVMSDLRLEEDFTLPNHSVIFVPSTTIAKLDRLVDQYIRQLLLFQGSSLAFTYELHREDQGLDSGTVSPQTYNLNLPTSTTKALKSIMVPQR